ncbi:unnamed protein product, partial [Ascophyllum nodosum]
SKHILEKATRPASTTTLRRRIWKGSETAGRRTFKDENGVLLRDVELIRKLCVRWFHTLLNAKSPRLDPNIAEGLDPNITEGLDQWPVNMPLEVQPTMQELTDALRLLANGKAVGPDGVRSDTCENIRTDTAMGLRKCCERHFMMPSPPEDQTRKTTTMRVDINETKRA